MVTFSRRLSLVALTLALAAGNPAVCAGWAFTPEARMSCCVGGKCPMHKSESSDGDGHQVMTQAQADSCCASSEQSESGPSTPTFAITIPSAILDTTTLLPAEPPALVLAEPWRVVPPLIADAVRKHVLLSVFLV